MTRLKTEEIFTDVAILGGGTAGCYGALTIARQSDFKVLVVEKADIRRSGCLAAGVNALNAYITKGHVPQDYVDYATKDAAGIVRSDLLLSAAEEFNEVTADLEQMGLVILKDENGEYVARGDRNIKINGENIKPLLAEAVYAQENIRVLNHVNITDLLTEPADGRRQGEGAAGGTAGTDSAAEKIGTERKEAAGGSGPQKVCGAVGFSVREQVAYVIHADAVLVATGGAAGLYRPNNPGYSRHKMWYPPFNTGAGYAMGICAGAEMTTFEMRFIALRCKDTIAPTGTLAQGVGAKQINSKGDIYETKYGITTSERVYGTVCENLEGRGPCYLKTTDIREEQSEDLLKAYLNMAPNQTLKWIETGKLPHEQDVEIAGTEPYIVGGHTASGYWVDTDRRTTLAGLYAAGDVAGGCPQKYVTGALAEGKLAARAIIKDILVERKVHPAPGTKIEDSAERGLANGPAHRESLVVQGILSEYERILNTKHAAYTVEQLEEAMQKVMDEYAGGIATDYRYNEKQLKLADQKIDQLIRLAKKVRARSMHDLLFAYELKERLTVCKAVIAHLIGRKETRWHAFNENLDHPQTDEKYFGYINSRLVNGKLQVYFRNLVTDSRYEHAEGNVSQCPQQYNQVL